MFLSYSALKETTLRYSLPLEIFSLLKIWAYRKMFLRYIMVLYSNRCNLNLFTLGGFSTALPRTGLHKHEDRHKDRMKRKAGSEFMNSKSLRPDTINSCNNFRKRIVVQFTSSDLFNNTKLYQKRNQCLLQSSGNKFSEFKSITTSLK